MNTRTAAGKTFSVVVYVIQVVLAALVLRAALAKFTGDRDMVNLFDGLAFGRYLRFGTGAVEVAAAIALLTRNASAYGAAVLAIVMLAASMFGMEWVGTSSLLWSSPATGGIPVLPNVLLLACLLVFWVRRNQLSRFKYLWD